MIDSYEIYYLNFLICSEDATNDANARRQHKVNYQALHYGAGVGTAPYYGVPGTDLKGVHNGAYGYGHHGAYNGGYGGGYNGGYGYGHNGAYNGGYGAHNGAYGYGNGYYGGYPAAH